MEQISLTKLNREGILIAYVKKNAFVRAESRMPYMYRQGDPTTCYLHYFGDYYYMTQHITTTIQLRFYKFEDAQSAFIDFMECIKD